MDYDQAVGWKGIWPFGMFSRNSLGEYMSNLPPHGFRRKATTNTLIYVKKHDIHINLKSCMFNLLGKLIVQHCIRIWFEWEVLNLSHLSIIWMFISSFGIFLWMFVSPFDIFLPNLHVYLHYVEYEFKFVFVNIQIEV